MTLASLSSYCQYPTVKTINKDTVVIMTLKQGQEINQKFSNLNDSILNLNGLLKQKKSEITVLNVEKEKLDTNLIFFKDKLSVSEKEIVMLNEQLTKNRKLYDTERIQWAGWMFLSFVVTVIVGALK